MILLVDLLALKIPDAFDRTSCSADDRGDKAHSLLRCRAQKVKVAALIRLKNVIDVKPGETPQMFAYLRRPVS